MHRTVTIRPSSSQHSTSGLCYQSGDCRVKRVCALNVTKKIHLIIEQPASPVKKQKCSGSATVLPQFLDCYMLLHAAYSGEVSIFESSLLPEAGSSTPTAYIWNVGIYTSDPN